MASVTPQDLAANVYELNDQEPLRDRQIDQYLHEDGPLVVGFDAVDELVSRDGGGVGNLLILGKSPNKTRLEHAILRAIQIIRPECTPPHSVINDTPESYEEQLRQYAPKGQDEILRKASIEGTKTVSTGEALRFFGPEALLQQVELAHSTMHENREFMEKYDLSEPPLASLHTLHIEHLDRLLPQNDKDGIYTMLGELASQDCMAAGVTLILSADNPEHVTKTLKDSILIISLAQRSQRASISLFGQRGMEIAEPHVGAMELRNGKVRGFRF